MTVRLIDLFSHLLAMQSMQKWTDNLYYVKELDSSCNVAFCIEEYDIDFSLHFEVFLA